MQYTESELAILRENPYAEILATPNTPKVSLETKPWCLKASYSIYDCFPVPPDWSPLASKNTQNVGQLLNGILVANFSKVAFLP